MLLEDPDPCHADSLPFIAGSRAPNISHFDVHALATSISGADEALYNVGGGQWHHEMGFSDPFFGSAQNMVSTYNTNLGKNPPYDGAACMAAGVFFSQSGGACGKNSCGDVAVLLEIG